MRIHWCVFPILLQVRRYALVCVEMQIVQKCLQTPPSPSWSRLMETDAD